MDSIQFTFKCLLNVDSFLGTSLKVGNIALGLAESHGSFRRDHALVFFDINFITNDNLYSESALDHKIHDRMKVGLQHLQMGSFRGRAD